MDYLIVIICTIVIMQAISFILAIIFQNNDKFNDGFLIFHTFIFFMLFLMIKPIVRFFICCYYKSKYYWCSISYKDANSSKYLSYNNFLISKKYFYKKEFLGIKNNQNEKAELRFLSFTPKNLIGAMRCEKITSRNVKTIKNLFLS